MPSAETRRKLETFLKYSSKSALAKEFGMTRQAMGELIKIHPDILIVYVGDTIDRIEYKINRVVYSVRHKDELSRSKV